MFRFFESIAIVEGKPRNLFLHQERMERTYKDHFQSRCPFKLQSLIEDLLENSAGLDKYKWKFSYSQTQHSNTIELYNNDPIKSFHLVSSALNYPYKFADRSELLHLKNKFVKSDEIIIVKDHKITDTSFSNLIFSDGINWYTPRIPLLRGTMREHLLRSNAINEEDIHVNDLSTFTKFKCINALNNLLESMTYEIQLINPYDRQK